MKSKKTGVTKEAATHCRAAVEAMQSEAQLASQAAEVFHRGVGEGGVVQVVPKGLDRIQLRGIRGEPLNLQPSAILLHRFGHASAGRGGDPTAESPDGDDSAAGLVVRIKTFENLNTPSFRKMTRGIVVQAHL